MDLLHVQHILDHAEQIRPFMALEYAANEDLWFAEPSHQHADFHLPEPIEPEEICGDQ